MEFDKNKVIHYFSTNEDKVKYFGCDCVFANDLSTLKENVENYNGEHAKLSFVKNEMDYPFLSESGKWKYLYPIPKIETVPFDNIDELYEHWVKNYSEQDNYVNNKPIIWIKAKNDNDVQIIIGYDDKKVFTYTSAVSLKHLYEDFTFLDGSPIGKSNNIDLGLPSGNLNYVDLGLPSGKLWKSSNEDDYYSFNEAIEKFKENLPTQDGFEELIKNTTHIFDVEKEGMVFTGKNGNTLFLPARGYKYSSDNGLVDDYGFYWSSKPNAYFPDWMYPGFVAYCLYFDDDHMNPEYIIDRSYSQSVVLIDRKMKDKEK